MIPELNLFSANCKKIRPLFCKIKRKKTRQMASIQLCQYVFQLGTWSLLGMLLVGMATSGYCIGENGTEESKKDMRYFRERTRRHHRSSYRSDKLALQDNYYTMDNNGTQFTLKIRPDGKIEWQQNSPTLYSMFREQVILGENKTDIKFTLEATATRYWICMNSTGRLYTVKRPKNKRKNGTSKAEKIRHKKSKKRRECKDGVHQKRKVGGRATNPPPDCLFKVNESNPFKSYRPYVGIYSYTHSNTTHGRFIAISATGTPRSYRKTFGNWYKQETVRISKTRISFLKAAVDKTRFDFGNSVQLNQRVRQCILHLLSCEFHKKKLSQDGHFYKIIEKCKKRALRTASLPKCLSIPTRSPRENNLDDCGKQTTARPG